MSQAEIECAAPAEAKQAEDAAEALHVTRRARHTSMSVGVVNIEEGDDEEDEDDGQAQAVQDLLGKIIKKNGNVDEQALKATPAESLEGAASGCLRSGWMRKEGSRNQSFKRRWFVLWRTPTLSEGDEAAAPVGKVTTMLIYYDDPKSTKANGLQLLTPGALKVAPPKKKRKEADFVVRLDHDVAVVTAVPAAGEGAVAVHVGAHPFADVVHLGHGQAIAAQPFRGAARELRTRGAGCRGGACAAAVVAGALRRRLRVGGRQAEVLRDVAPQDCAQLAADSTVHRFPNIVPFEQIDVVLRLCAQLLLARAREHGADVIRDAGNIDVVVLPFSRLRARRVELYAELVQLAAVERVRVKVYDDKVFAVLQSDGRPAAATGVSGDLLLRQVIALAPRRLFAISIDGYGDAAPARAVHGGKMRDKVDDGVHF